MSTATDKTIALNIRLKPTESSAHPRVTNYTKVGVTQAIAYVDCGFIEPVLLAKMVVDSQNGKAVPGQVEGKFVAESARDSM